ncbi:MAG TPA: Tad domain-containing protein [Acidimicrobiia bacterium]|nr:Tad domain-containing protein [Acidimicrobiia bacterium]
MILVAASLFLLIGVAALAVDLSGIRLDRAVDQRVADSAASAGAITVFESGSGAVGCSVALEYVAANAAGIASINTDCSTVPASCDPLAASTVTKTAGRFTVTVVYPVPDAHALMSSGTLGSPGQSVIAEDAGPCDRIGVQIASVRDATFSRVLGAPAGTTTIHSVAIADEGAGDAVPLNLLILDRTGCQTVRSSGEGGIIVSAIVDGADVYPGHGAADSNGSECTGTDGVFFKEGSNSILRADGPVGCVGDDPATPTIGEGCGLLETVAATTPGMCAPPGCQSNGPPSVNPQPLPTTMGAPLTRAPIDHRYNCVSNYATAALAASLSWATDPLLAADGQDIPGCSGGDRHIYDLIEWVGSSGGPVGYNKWTDLYPCTVTNPITPAAGNWWVDCASFEVKDPIPFIGNVIFDGHVAVTSETGALTVDNTGDGDGFAFFRNGVLTKDGQADLAFLDTFVYFSNSSNITMVGGTGSLEWIAPTTGPYEDLALWSDSETANHVWAGQANLDLEGVFFVPRATVEYAGQSSQVQVSAQFIAHRIWARGQGALVLQPEIGRAVPLTGRPFSTLIR